MAPALALMSAFTAGAAPPAPEFFHPAGIAAGATNTVKVTGKFDPWPPRVWVDAPGLIFQAQTNAGEWRVSAAADAAPGVRLVRFHNAEGVSEPRPFVVGAGPELAEREPNDTLEQAQAIERLPVTINGRLDKAGDVDAFAVDLRAGQTLEAAVDSIVLMSKLDAILRLVTTNGLPLAWNQDYATQDPRLTWAATNDQRVVVQVFGFPYPANSDVRFTGGEGAIYRLQLRLLPPTVRPTNTVDTTAAPPPLVAPPFHSAGSIRAPGQRHRVRVRLAEAGWLAAGVRAESVGSPLDAWLELEDAKGKQISRNDDHDGSRDPYLDWRAEAEREYTLVVGSVTRQAGEDQRFEFDLRRVSPDFRAHATADAVTAKPGTTNEFKVKFARLRGFTNEVRLVARDLPPGVECAAATAPAKDGEVTLSLVALTNAAPFQGPWRLVSQSGGAERAVPYLLTGSTQNNGVPGGYRVLLADHLDVLWLTVPTNAPPAAKAPEKSGK